jgi:hypothetical protein
VRPPISALPDGCVPELAFFVGIKLALWRDEGLESERLSSLAEEINDSARRHGLYEPLVWIDP